MESKLGSSFVCGGGGGLLIEPVWNRNLIRQ